MQRRWTRISPPDEKWTPATWLLFLGLFALYFFLLAGITRFWFNWFEAVRLGVLSIGDLLAHPAARLRGGTGVGVIIAICGTGFVLIFPLLIILIPTLFTLQWIMKRLNEKRK